MVREEIVAGLRQAISKGESLEKAMISFYNAGYTKEDIEEAARFLQAQILQAQQLQQALASQQQPKKLQKSSSKPSKQQSQQSDFRPLPPPPASKSEQTSAQTSNYPGIVQRVSSYGAYGRRPKTESTLTIIFFILLFILFGILVATILFKDELSVFFNNLFWRIFY